MALKHITPEILGLTKIWKIYLLSRLKKHKKESIISSKKQTNINILLLIMASITLSISMLNLGRTFFSKNLSTITVIISIDEIIINIINIIIVSYNTSKKFGDISRKHYNTATNIFTVINDLQLIEREKYATDYDQIMILVKGKIDFILKTAPLIEKDRVLNILGMNINDLEPELRQEIEQKIKDDIETDRNFRNYIHKMTPEMYDNNGIGYSENENNTSYKSDDDTEEKENNSVTLKIN